MITYKLEDFRGKQITGHRSNIVPFYPKQSFFQEKTENYFSNNSLLRLHPQKPNITKPKSVSLSKCAPDITADNEPSHNHLTIRLDNPNQTQKTTLLETSVYENSQRKTTEHF